MTNDQRKPNIQCPTGAAEPPPGLGARPPRALQRPNCKRRGISQRHRVRGSCCGRGSAQNIFATSRDFHFQTRFIAHDKSRRRLQVENGIRSPVRKRRERNDQCSMSNDQGNPKVQWAQPNVHQGHIRSSRRKEAPSISVERSEPPHVGCYEVLECAREPRSCSADFQVCCIAGFQTRRPYEPSNTRDYAAPGRFGNRRYSRFGNLRYVGFWTLDILWSLDICHWSFSFSPITPLFHSP
jgi:hypothetical protein